MDAGLFSRLVRIQFTPIMAAPVALGAAAAWHDGFGFKPVWFLLAMVGALCLHLAANAIDDVYDFRNGTDQVSERLFPSNAPGWKPIPRGLIRPTDAVAITAALYLVSLAIGVLLSVEVGWLALGFAIPGILLSYFYVAPPLKLDYRGLGLGELSVVLSFGPIPVLGAYYVMSGDTSPLIFAIGVPSGLLTAGILISHDLIFYQAYRESGKRSLAVVLGKKGASVLGTCLALVAYLLVGALVIAKFAPATSLLVLAASPLLAKSADFRGVERSPPDDGKRTMMIFVHSVAFTFLLAAGLILG